MNAKVLLNEAEIHALLTRLTDVKGNYTALGHARGKLLTALNQFEKDRVPKSAEYAGQLAREGAMVAYSPPMVDNKFKGGLDP